MSLLLLFSGGGGAEFPNLYVRDVQSGQPVPVGGLAGWDEAFLQSTTICQAPMLVQAIFLLRAMIFLHTQITIIIM